MILAKNEEIIREWDYCQTARGITGNGIARLTVTNKRIVSEVSESAVGGKENLKRIEVLIKDVCGLTIVKKFASNVGAVLTILLGLVVMVIGVALCALVHAACIAITLIGLLILVKGIISLNKAGFILYIKSKGEEYVSLALGASTLGASKKKSADIKVKTDKAVINEIYDTIGAAIVDGLD